MQYKNINFVMSNNVKSSIFNSIIEYFEEYLYLDNFKLHVSEKPLKNMDVYHYHRPNLEKKLLNNSVVTVHHDLDDTDEWLSINHFINRYKEADKIICLNSIQQDILKNNGINKNIIIPHGINQKVFKNDNNRNFLIEGKKFVIGIISKRYPRRVKGEAYLFELLKRLNPKFIKFILVGDNRNLDVKEFEKFNFEVDVYEKLPYQLFNDLYKNINLLLVPSLFEGGPANIPEALYMNVPIFTRNIAMAHDYIKNGTNGFFIDNFNINNDAELINALAENKDNIYNLLIENTAEYNKKIVLSWKDVVLKHIEVYNNIINKGK